QVHPRRGGGAASARGALLFEESRPGRRGRARAPHVRVRARGSRPDRGGAHPGVRRPDAPGTTRDEAGGEDEGARMITDSVSRVRELRTTDWDVERVRRDFPALHQEVHGKPLVYLDNAATSQKPQVVIDALTAYYARDNANVHRGVHLLSERATDAYESARDRIQRHLNAASRREIVFVRQATEAINLV